MCMCLCTFLLLLQIVHPVHAFSSARTITYNVFECDSMHSRLCMYLYVCQHKMELTHTYTDREGDIHHFYCIRLLQYSLNAFEIALSFSSSPSFFLFFCYILVSYDFVSLCHSFTLCAVPFIHFHGTSFCCQRFTSRNNHFKPIYLHILVLKYSYLCTQSNNILPNAFGEIRIKSGAESVIDSNA